MTIGFPVIICIDNSPYHIRFKDLDAFADWLGPILTRSGKEDQDD